MMPGTDGLGSGLLYLVADQVHEEAGHLWDIADRLFQRFRQPFPLNAI